MSTSLFVVFAIAVELLVQLVSLVVQGVVVEEEAVELLMLLVDEVLLVQLDFLVQMIGPALCKTG